MNKIINNKIMHFMIIIHKMNSIAYLMMIGLLR